jgi:hypothetical protein
MISPEEKAVFLFYSFYNVEIDTSWEQAKQCALICVDEIINANPSYDDYGGDGWIIIDNTGYWNEVKNEINKL